MGSKDFLEYPPGATPLDPDELNGLIPDYISTQGELNILEQENILKAQTWAFKRKRTEILSENFARALHRRMFGDVWRWAGQYRTSDKNIGIDWRKIPEEVAKLCQDARYWVEQRSYDVKEAAVRFHHRLVLIHSFANGNGRHARFMTDLFLESLEQPAFSWGSVEGAQNSLLMGPIRERYLAALRAADQRNFAPLIEFVGS